MATQTKMERAGNIPMQEISRTQKLRKKILKAPYEICIERARYYTQIFKETEGQHPSLRAAKALEKTLDNMTTYILPEEIIVGNRSSKLVATVIPIERGDVNLFMGSDLSKLQKRKDHPFKIGAAEKKELQKEILPYWKDKTLRYKRMEETVDAGLFNLLSFSPGSIISRLRNFGIFGLIKTLKPLVIGRISRIFYWLKQAALNNPDLVNNIFDVQGHLILGINKVIEVGFKGIKEKALESKKNYEEGSEQSLFLDSVIISCEAVKRFAQKFSDLANQMAEEETDLKRKEELLLIAKNMKKVPWEPPTSFHEAIQFAWFTLDVALISQGVAGIIAIGRPDQYLYPFYKNDIDNGNITEKIALELIEEFMIKTSYNLIPLAEFAKMTASELGADENAITVGGVAENGEDGANGLTYLFLDAIANIKNMTNSFSIRMSSQSSEEYLLKIADVYSKTSGPALFNDDIIVPSLMKNGYTIEEARDYGLIGCVEPASSGNSFSCTSGNDISLAGVLEMVLNNGKLRMMGKRTGLKTGKFEDFKSFEEILEAYKKQLFHTIEKISKHIDVKDKIYSREFHNPYISLTFEGCIENGTDMTQGGAKYSFGSIGGRGISTVADSLIAIKKAVFEDKIVTLKELKKALNSNFRGKEALRQKLINKYPKYGNDNDEVDDLIKWIADIFCDEVNTKKNIWGQCVRPGFFSFGMHVFDGSYLGATPNGRKAGMPVNNSMSPNNGCERNGPTAVIKSYSKINHEKISNGSSLNIRLLPSSIETDKGKKNLASILKAFIDLKGMHVQFNVVDNKILKEAQKHPDDYRDLVVRVSGYNAYFTDLGKPVQEDIIKRTQFSDY